jgi:drug/metabolite transporter (DMT)-like permease
LTSALLWSLGGPLIKLLAAHDVPPAAQAMYRSFFAGLLLLPGAVLARPKTLPVGWLAASVIASAAGYFCFVTATVITEAANAIVLQYTFAFWVFLLGPLLLREHARRADWIILLWAMIGVTIIFWGQRQTDLLGLCLALGAGLAVGITVLALRRLREVSSAFVVCVNQLGTAALLAPIALQHPRIAGQDWALLIGLGWFQIGVPYVTFAMGMRYLRAQEASLLTLAEPVLNPVWTYLAIGEVPTPTTLIGGTCILTSLAGKAAIDWRAAQRAVQSPGQGRRTC